MAGTLLIYVHDLRVSGVVKNALAIARRVSRERPVILCSGPGPQPNPLPDIGSAELIILPPAAEGSVDKISTAQELRHLIQQSGAVSVLSAGNLGHHAVLEACEGLSVKTAYRVSNAVGRPAGWWKNFRRQRHHRRLIRSSSLIILVGQSFRDNRSYARAIRQGKAVEIPNGIDVDRARKEGAAPSPHPWMDEDVPVVLGIGRIHPQKNFPLLIDASAKAMAKVSHRLVILGDGPKEAVEALIDQSRVLGIEDRVLLPGRVDNVYAWLSRAALFALVSRWEGSSNALLEAMAVGTPVLVTDSAGDASSVLDKGRFGRLVSGDDIDAVAAGIVDQLTKPIGPGNRAESYRVDDTLERYAELLKDF